MSLLAAVLPAAVLAAAARLLLPRLQPEARWPRVITIGVTFALLARYAWWRMAETLPAPAWSWEAGLAYAYLVCEATLLAFVTLNLVILTRFCDRREEARRAASWLDELPEPPLVDVLIPTYSEPREVVARTLAGARRLDYPRFRVWLLDDGRREWVRDLAREQGVPYLTRGDNVHAKAGNLNSGLAQIEERTELGSFVAVFDADFVPQHDFLRRALALFQNPRIGLVQTPQCFFNHGPQPFNFRAEEVWPEEQRVQYDMLLPSREAWGTAFCCGTSWILRREALRSIVRVPTDSLTEDYLMSLRLGLKGWKTAYLNERLSAGLAPAGLLEYISQRCRWAIGTMQIFRGRHGVFSRHPIGLVHRLHLLDHFGYWGVMTALRLLDLVVPIVYWLSGLFVFQASFAGFLAFWAPYAVAKSLLFAWLSRTQSLPLTHDVNQLMMSFDVARASLAGLFRRRGHRFQVTAKEVSRGRQVVHWGLLLRFAVLAAATLAGMALAVLPGIGPELDPETTAIVLVLSLLNVPVLLTACLACVERPRLRLEERVRLDEAATVGLAGRTFHPRLADLSLSGAALAWDDPPAGDTALAVELAGVGRIDATVVRTTEAGCAVRFVLGDGDYEALVRKVYSGRYTAAAGGYRFVPVCRAVLRRALELCCPLLPTRRRRVVRPRIAKEPSRARL